MLLKVYVLVLICALNDYGMCDLQCKAANYTKSIYTEFWKTLKGIFTISSFHNNLLLYDDTIRDCKSAFLNFIDQIEAFDIYFINNRLPFDIESTLHTHFNCLNGHKQVITLVGGANFITKTLDVAKNIDKQLNQHGHFLFSYKWIIIPNTSCDKMVDSIKPFYHVICIEHNSENAHVNDICTDQIGITSIKTALFETKKRVFQNVSFNKEGNLLDKNLFPNAAYRFNSQHFLLGAQVFSPIYFNHYFDNATNESTYSGIYYDVIQEFSRYLNMSYSIVLPQDGAWGHITENGTWSGLVGQLANREVDFVITPLTVSFIRSQVIDYADHHLETTYITGYYRKQNYTISALRLLLSPFQADLWATLLISLSVYSFIIGIVQETRFCILKNEDHIRIKTLFYGVIGKFYRCACTFVGQNVSLERTKSIPLRVMWSCWLLFGIIMLCSWSANIMSHLTIPKHHTPMKNFYDLIAQDSYKYGTTEDAITGLYLSTSTLYPIADIWKNMKRFDEYDDDILSSGYGSMSEKVKSDNFVYFIDSTHIQYEMSMDCNLCQLSENLLTTNYAVGLQQNSAYKDLMNKASLWIVETGIMDKIFEKWQSKQTCKADKMQTTLTLQHTLGVFHLLGFGCLISGIVCYTEFLSAVLASFKSNTRRCKIGNTLITDK